MEINKDLRKNPSELGYVQNLWDRMLLSYHLRNNYTISMGFVRPNNYSINLDYGTGNRALLSPRVILSLKKPYKKIADLKKQENVDISLENECHFQQHGGRCYMGVPPVEKDPIIFLAPTKSHTSVFGAVSVRMGSLFIK